MFQIERMLLQPGKSFNTKTPGLSEGFFLPHYHFFIQRYDCVSALTSHEVVMISEYAPTGSKGPFGPNSSPQQKLIMIEGRPYWAYAFPEKLLNAKPLEWKSTRPGSNGAYNLEKACSTYR